MFVKKNSERKMINCKLNRCRIVYVIPPPCMKFLKRKSILSRCSTQTVFDPNPKCADPSEIAVNDSKWRFGGRTAESSSETNQPTVATATTPFYQTTATAIPSQVRTTQFSSKTTDISISPGTVPSTVTSIPAIPSQTGTTKRVSATYKSSGTDEPKFVWRWKTKSSTTVFPLSAETESPITKPESTGITPSPPTKQKYTSTTSTTGTGSTGTTGTRSSTIPEIGSTPTSGITATSAETKCTSATTVIPTTCNTSTPSCEIPKKCLEWYNKIKDADQCDISGNCSRWFNLIKDDDKLISVKSLCSKVGSSETYCPPNLSRLALNRTNKYSDIRPGIEYFQPIFSSSPAAAAAAASEVLDNPFMKFLITRPRSNKKGSDVFNLTIDDRIRTLKWLNQQILQRYGMLAKIDRITRANRSFANASNSKTASRKVSVNSTHKTTRAQRLRDEFIKKKMQRMSLDKNDGWWKNFNAKSYRKSSTGFNFLNSVQEVE